MNWKNKFEEPKIGDRVRLKDPTLCMYYQSGIATIIDIFPVNNDFYVNRLNDYFIYQIEWPNGQQSDAGIKNVEVVERV